MFNQPFTQAHGPVINRVSELMSHLDSYMFWGVSKLARDAGISPSSVSRLINQRLNPSFLLVARITAALEAELGHRIDPRELVAENGAFLTKHVCDAVGCPGCLPDAAYEADGTRRALFKDVQPGKWVTSRYPLGFSPEKKGGIIV